MIVCTYLFFLYFSCYSSFSVNKSLCVHVTVLNSARRRQWAASTPPTCAEAAAAAAAGAGAYNAIQLCCGLCNTSNNWNINGYRVTVMMTTKTTMMMMLKNIVHRKNVVSLFCVCLLTLVSCRCHGEFLIRKLGFLLRL